MSKNVGLFLRKQPHIKYNTRPSRKKDFDYVVQPKEHLHIYEHRPYHNLFELRKVKNHFLVNDMPNLVKNYILIRHEDLLYDFENTMNLIRSTGLTVKTDIDYPKQIKNYYHGRNKANYTFYKNKRRTIPTRIIKSKIDLKQEEKIFGNYLITEE